MSTLIPLLAHGKNSDLLWRHPRGERTTIMFYQSADESLHRAEQGSMDYDCLVGFIIGTDIFKPEPMRHLEV